MTQEMERFIAHFNANDHCSRRLGIQVVAIGEGTSEVMLTMAPYNSNFMGGLHGGAIATLCDIAGGCATYHHQQACVTLDCNLRYLAGVHGGSVRAKARELHASKRVSVCQVDVYDEASTLCCTCTLTMYRNGKPLPHAYLQMGEVAK